MSNNLSDIWDTYWNWVKQADDDWACDYAYYNKRYRYTIRYLGYFP